MIAGPLLFLIYINNLHKAIQFWKVRHFADNYKSFSYKQVYKKSKYASQP